MFKKYENENIVLSDLKKTLELLKGNMENEYDKIIRQTVMPNNIFGYISQVYPFTNELMYEYNLDINLKNKKVLTVTSSSDQILISMLKDANIIDSFDCNKLTYYYLFFKLALIESLTYEEFKSFYNFCSNNDINKIDDYYNNIKYNIKKEDVKLFWNIFFKKKNINFNKLFLCHSTFFDIYNIGYNNKIIYNQLKDKIHDRVNFKNINVFDIPNVYNEQYDFINLSNIINYTLNKEKYSKLVKKIIDNNLTQDGVILANYIWGTKNLNNKEIISLEKLNCNPTIKIISLYKKNFTKLGNYKSNSNNFYKVENAVVFCKKK